MSKPSDSLKILLKLINDEKLAFLKNTFGRFDIDNSGTLDVAELGEMLRSMGRQYSDQEIRDTLFILTENSEIDSIDFEQFAFLMQFDVLGTSNSLPQVEFNTQTQPIQILYFFDILCTWSYVSRIRLDELQSTFKDQIQVNYHFVPIFGDVHRKIEKGWGDRGGIEAFSKKIRGIINQFNHVDVHPEAWSRIIPHSSSSCHLFLRAVKLLEEKDLVETSSSKTPFEQAAFACQEAFFKNVRDICDRISP